MQQSESRQKILKSEEGIRSTISMEGSLRINWAGKKESCRQVSQQDGVNTILFLTMRIHRTQEKKMMGTIFIFLVGIEHRLEFRELQDPLPRIGSWLAEWAFDAEG